MRRPLLHYAFFILVGMLAGGGFWAARTSAQDASPVAGAGSTILVLVEHNDAMTDILRDEAGAAVGDLRVWGPNALYDEANTTDTGATTQGTCVALNAEFDCLADETIVFADGSTLEIQGVQLGNAVPSTRTIVGGSGQYLGAAGTVSVAPTEDLTLWTKTIEIVPWVSGCQGIRDGEIWATESDSITASLENPDTPKPCHPDKRNTKPGPPRYIPASTSMQRSPA